MSRFESRRRSRGRSIERGGDARGGNREYRRDTGRTNDKRDLRRFDPNRKFFRLYVGNLSTKTEMIDIEKLCEEYGDIQDVEFKGSFCFIEFRSSRSARDALDELNGYRFNGNVLLVEEAKDRRSREPRTFSRSRSRSRGRSSRRYAGIHRDTNRTSQEKDSGRYRRDIRDYRADLSKSGDRNWVRRRTVTPPKDRDIPVSCLRKNRSGGERNRTNHEAVYRMHSDGDRPRRARHVSSSSNPKRPLHRHYPPRNERALYSDQKPPARSPQKTSYD